MQKVEAWNIYLKVFLDNFLSKTENLCLPDDQRNASPKNFEAFPQFIIFQI